MSEHVATVVRLVGSMLDAPIDDAPRAVAECVRFRSATRRIIEAGLPAEEEDRLLSALARRAARTELSLWVLDAIVAEIREPDPYPVPPLSRELAAARLRRLGYDACPTCHAVVPSEAEVDHWRRRRQWNERDAEVRRQAAPLVRVAS